MNSFRFSRIVIPLAALCVLSPGKPLFAQDVETLARELRGESVAQMRTPAELSAAYMRVLASLLSDLISDDVDKHGAAADAWQRIAWHAARPNAEAERVAAATATASQLGAQVPLVARRALLKALETLGAREVVAAITVLLDDENPLIREGARRALQSNPSREAGDALRQALQSAQTPETRVAFINALAARREASSVASLARFAAENNGETSKSAIVALGEIGGAEAVLVLQNLRENAPASTREAATNALIVAAERYLQSGNSAGADAIYSALYNAQETPVIRVAALRGLVMARGEKATPLLFAALTGEDARLQQIAGRFVGEIPGTATTRAFAALLPKLPTAGQITLLEELGARGDIEARPAVMASLQNKNLDVRAAALAALGQLGDATNALALATLAANGKGAEREAARAAVAAMHGSAVNSALLIGLKNKSTSAPVRAELIRTLAARRAIFAIPTLMLQLRNRDVATQSEAIRALGALGEENVVPALTNLVVETPSSATRAVATQSLAAVYDRRISQGASSRPIVEMLSQAKTPARIALISVLRHAADDDALAAVRGELTNFNAATQDAAVRALSEWPDAQPLDDLLQIARSDEKIAHRITRAARLRPHVGDWRTHFCAAPRAFARGHECREARGRKAAFSGRDERSRRCERAARCRFVFRRRDIARRGGRGRFENRRKNGRGRRTP